jgi:hypothetical protein
MTFGGPRIDSAIAKELLRAVEPMAIEAAFKAERMHREQQEEQQRILDLELRQARYEVTLRFLDKAEQIGSMQRH